MAPQATLDGEPVDTADAPSLLKVARGKGAANTAAEETWLANGVFVILTHLVALGTVVLYQPSRTILVAVAVVWWLTMLGITAGYHRLWSHRAFKASLPLRAFLAFWGTNGFQGSIKWWVLRHRLHHRFTDTEDDPYSSKRGFFFSHIGWIFTKPHYPKIKLIDASDLNADPVVVFQHRHYVPLALFVGFLLPPLVASLWGEALSGLLWGGFVTRVFIWHATFCINSVAHYLGDRVYSTQISARGNLVCALLTNGEGYHNFHHAFPKDYRNGINWYDWDPTKWAITLWSALGLASDLYESPKNEISKAKVLVQENELRQQRQQLDWGPTDEALPLMTKAEFDARRAGQLWVVIDGFVHDLQHFAHTHPGGDKILRAYAGKDASAAFNGGLNQHTEAARNSARMYRIARLSLA